MTEPMQPQVRIGMKFKYNGKMWQVTTFSANKVFFKEVGSNLKSQMDLTLFLKTVEILS